MRRRPEWPAISEEKLISDRDIDENPHLVAKLAMSRARIIVKDSGRQLFSDESDLEAWVVEHASGWQVSIIKHLKERNWLGYFICHDNHLRLGAFVAIEAALTDAEYWRYLRDVWLWEEVSFPIRKHWIQYLSSKRGEGSIEMMTDEERQIFHELPDPFTIYRGVGDKKHRFGLSWTLSRSKAEWFTGFAIGVRRQMCYGLLATGRYLVTASCPKRLAAAYLAGRGEEEILVTHPRSLTRVSVQGLPSDPQSTTEPGQ